MEYDGFVCTDDMGDLITPEYVTTHFKYVIDKNGLKHIRFHDLRHTCASLLIANHIPLKAVQDWLGHANFQTTIPVPNSNTNPHAVPTDKNNQYNSNKGRYQTMQRYRPYIFFSEALFSFPLQCSLSFCPISLHTVSCDMLLRFCAE